LHAAGNARKAKRDWVDIDEANAGNPLACSEYAALIFQHLSTAEVRCCRGGVRVD
jgi:hypothetical protein